MIRTIKFRAWDGKNMVTDFCIWADGKLSEGDGTLSCTYENVMQYTGLNDKNGKEIYEGDIIAMPTPESDNVVIEKSVVFYHKKLAEYKLDPRDGSGYRKLGSVYFGRPKWNIPNLVEVIGNIYENPELLTDSKSNENR